MNRTALSRPIYMDYQATTPVDSRVLDAMLPFFSEKFGNPHSLAHLYGWEAEEAVEMAREQVAHLIGASANEIIFTSGATESNNLAIKGVANFLKSKKTRLVTVATEHKCVLESMEAMKQSGYEVIVLPVKGNGLIDLNQLEDAVTEDTALVSVMMVNNETGVMQDLHAISRIVKAKNILLHSDIAQGFGKVPIDVTQLPVDLLSISGHKYYAPKGIGALYIRRRPRVRLLPLFHGGGQERLLRAGTLPVPLIVALGKAASLSKQLQVTEGQHIQKLSQKFISHIRQKYAITLHGEEAERFPGCVNIGFDVGNANDSLLISLKGLAVSSGSACTSGSVEPSYVLGAMGVRDVLAKNSIRFGIGRMTTEEEIDQALHIIDKALK